MGTSTMPGRRTAPESWTSVVPGSLEDADGGVGTGAIGHDPGHRGQRLDVVDDGGLAPQAPARRDGVGAGRAVRAGPRALAAARSPRPARTTPTAAGPRCAACRPVPIASSPRYPFVLRGGDGAPQPLDGHGGAGIDRDDRVLRAHRPCGERHPLDDRVGVDLHERSVEPGRRGPPRSRWPRRAAPAPRSAAHAAPLVARGEACAAPTPQAGVLTSRMTCSGVSDAAAWRQAVQAPAASAAPMSRRGVCERPRVPAGSTASAASPARIAIRRSAPGARSARSAAAMVAASVGGRLGQHAAIHDDARRRPRLAAAIGGLEPDGAIRAEPAHVRAQMLPEGGEHPRRRPGACTGRSGRPGTTCADGRLETQVRVAGGDAVQLAVPGARLVRDVLERRDRQVAVGVLGLLEDAHRVPAVGSRAGRGWRRAARGRWARRARTWRPAPAGRTGAGRTPRAARRTARAGPSGRGTGRACPRRPCRCTRWGRPPRTGSRSRT